MILIRMVLMERVRQSRTRNVNGKADLVAGNESEADRVSVDAVRRGIAASAVAAASVSGASPASGIASAAVRGSASGARRAIVAVHESADAVAVAAAVVLASASDRARGAVRSASGTGVPVGSGGADRGLWRAAAVRFR